MAIIYTYPNKNAPAPDDLIVITDSEDARKTKRARLSSLKAGLNVVDSITAVLPVVASSSTKDVTLSLSGLNGFGTSGQVIKVNSTATGLEYGDASAVGDTYDLNAGAKVGNKVPLNLTSGSGTDNSTVELEEGNNITLTQVGSTVIKIESTGGQGSLLTISQDGTAVDTDVTDINFISGFAAVDDPNTVGKVDINAVYNTSLGNAIATTSNLGGIPAGTTVADLKGDTFVSIFDELLFPTALPTYTRPTRTLSSTVTGTKEVGTTHSPALTAGGNKNDAGVYTDLSITKRINNGSVGTLTSGAPIESSASNLPAQFGFANANNPNKSYGKSFTDTGLVVPAPASGSTSSVVYGSTANYDAGLPLKDSKGVDDTRPAAVRTTTNPQAASNGFASVNRTITGLYPFYHFRQASAISTSDMVTAIQNGSAVPIVASASGTITIPLAINNQFLAVAYPATNTTKTKYFVTSLDQGAITVVFNPVATSSANSPTGLWSGISFKIHTSNSALTLTGSTMQLRNS
tara:strand:+ start:467 stop:2023 length:1557 start_codon:yes stop_codon:yes gene_type:complete